MSMKQFYLGTTIIGLGVALVLIAQWFSQYGMDMGAAWTQLVATDMATIAAWDLSWTAVAALGFIIAEGIHKSIRGWWLAVIGSFCVGLCFGLPLFLYLRERAKGH